LDPADRIVSGIFEEDFANSSQSAPEQQKNEFPAEKTGLFKPFSFEDTPENSLPYMGTRSHKITLQKAAHSRDLQADPVAGGGLDSL